MRNALNHLNHRFHKMRPGSVLILVVALLVLMALIGTAFLSTSRVDRTATVQHTTNTEIDLLVEGMKNIAQGAIAGGLNDPSLPVPFRPANSYPQPSPVPAASSTLAYSWYSTVGHNWNMPDLVHYHTDDAGILTTPNDAWLSPRCPAMLDPMQWQSVQNPSPSAWVSLTSNPNGWVLPSFVVWPCIGEPLVGNTFESPFVMMASPSTMSLVSGVPLTYRDRVTAAFIPPAAGSSNPPVGSNFVPSVATITYPDGTTASFPSFFINYKDTNSTTSANSYYYLAGDADGDGIADCGMFKLPVGQINGLTYYAGVRIIDNSAALNINTAMSRRYDFNANGVPTRFIDPSSGTGTYSAGYNLSFFQSNVGLAEMLQSYDGSSNNNTGNLGTEFGAWMSYLLGNRYALSTQSVAQPPASSSVPLASGSVLSAPLASPIFDDGTARTDFTFTSVGDLLASQLGRRPLNPGNLGTSSAAYLPCLPATDSDAAALAYHFVFNNPNVRPSPAEQILHSSLYDSSANGAFGPPNRLPNLLYNISPAPPVGPYPGIGSTSYVADHANCINVLNSWYVDNFDWNGHLLATYAGAAINPFNPSNLYAAESAVCANTGTFQSMSVAAASGNGSFLNNTDARAGWSYLPRRSIFTADSAVSNQTPRPVLSNFTASNGAITIVNGMSPIPVSTGTPTPGVPSTLPKASINTASFGDLWRAYWLAMTGDNGASPLGTNTSASGTPLGTNNKSMFDHDLYTGQSIYTGSQFTSPVPSGVVPSGGGLPSQNASQAAAQMNTAVTAPQHPQAMLRSTLRNPTGTFYNYNSSVASPGTGRNDSYIEADQMALLRSAIAATNVEAMRDPSKGSGATIHVHDVLLNATVDGTLQQVTARVYGVSQQPFISEVYVSTDTASTVTATDTAGGTTPGLTNTVPYVAIELFNPYKQAINLDGWELAAIDRSPTSETSGSAGGPRNMTVIHIFGKYDFVPAYTAPSGRPAASTTTYQGGYALLENVKYTGAVLATPSVTPPIPIPDSSDTPAKYRPASANSSDVTTPTPTDGYVGTSPNPAMQTAGAASIGGVPLNDIYVPGLKRIIALATAAEPDGGEELVLLRPVVGGTVAAPAAAETVIDQVPVDSFDFTGLTYDPTMTPPGATADVWHYVRGNAMSITPAAGSSPAAVSGNSLWRFIYPGRYDATDPTPYASTTAGTLPTAASTANPVGASPVNPKPYPSNPAGDRLVSQYPALGLWSRRQQGTQAAHFSPSATPNKTKDPFAPPTPSANFGVLSPAVTLGVYTTPAATPDPNQSISDNPAASFPITFPFQYLNNDQPGPLPLVAGVNNFPFGQFARNSDMLQVPFVGSYVVFLTTPTAIPANSAAAPLTVAQVTGITEVNPLPMDCSFAEDTDLTDDPPDGDTISTSGTDPYIWNESVGHFAPINTGATDTRLYRPTLATDPYVQTQIADADPTLAYSDQSGSANDPYAAYKLEYSTDVTLTMAYRYWRYHWASRMFDYLTVQNPNDDYFPNVQQQIYSATPASAFFPSGYGPLPLPVQNTSAVTPAGSPTNTSSEDAVPVYGLININTAPWRVLSALRLCPFDDAEMAADGTPLSAQFMIDPFLQTVTPYTRGAPAAPRVPDNVALAQAIAYWRDFGVSYGSTSNVSPQVTASTTPPVSMGTYPYTIYKGPFTSLSDVLNVPAVQSYLQQLNFLKTSTSSEPNAAHGHISPYIVTPTATPMTDGVRNDQEERMDLLDRISNQATVKSDSYTVYIVVQGWRNAGSSSASNPPSLVTQRRAAFIIDRSGVTPTSSNVKIINVPTD